MRLAKYAALAAAALAAAAPGLASAQTTGSRLPATNVEGVTVIGAITDGSEVRGEDPADAAIAELPAVYEDEPAAETAEAPASAE